MTDLRKAAQQALEALGSGNPYHQQLAAKVLRTALEQQAEPPEWLLIKNILDEYGLQAIDFVAEFKAAQQQAEPVATFQDGVLEGQLREREYWVKQQAEPVAWDVFELRLYGAPQQKQHRVLWVDRYTQPDGSTPDLDGLLEAAKTEGGIDGGAKTLHVRPLYAAPPQQQAEPVCPKCKAAVLYECVACSSNNYPPKQQAEPPQRPWVGLTDEEILSTDPWEILRADPWMGTSDSNINPYQILLKVRTLEAKLKERNT
jgi:hypothetical protein